MAVYKSGSPLCISLVYVLSRQQYSRLSRRTRSVSSSTPCSSYFPPLSWSPSPRAISNAPLFLRLYVRVRVRPRCLCERLGIGVIVSLSNDSA